MDNFNQWGELTSPLINYGGSAPKWGINETISKPSCTHQNLQASVCRGKNGGYLMFNQNDTEKDTPDVDTIEETNWENANALVDKLMGVGQK